MRTFYQIQTEVFNQLKEDYGDTGFWDIDEVKNAINDAYAHIADETLCFRLISIIEIQAGIRIYKMPYNYIIGSLNRVEFDEKKIFPITSDELDEYSRSWKNVEASVITHYLPPGDICNTDEIAVYPMPDTDGAVYNLASTSEDNGVVTTIGDTSYEEFNEEEGVIVDDDGDAKFEELEGSGPVFEIKDPTNNLTIYAARYPKRLYNDTEVFLHPISFNPRRIITYGALSFLLSKEGEGKDIAKASYYNKRFEETMDRVLKRQKVKRMHTIKSITDSHPRSGYLNLGEHYPSYNIN